MAQARSGPTRPRALRYAAITLKPPSFAYRAPDSLGEALHLLAENGDEAKLLAGGQSLMPLLALRLARPGLLVDLAHVPELGRLAGEDGWLRFGAMVRELTAERSAEVRRRLPLLAETLPLIAHPAIRSRGTIGGSLAHADPAAELPAVTVALRAELRVESERRGARTLSATGFFVSHFTTALEPDEILTEVRFPTAGVGTGFAFEEFSRRHGDFALVGVAALVRVGEGRIREARVAVTGVAGRPVLVTEETMGLVAEVPVRAGFAAAGEVVAKSVSPPSDLHGSGTYRRHLTKVLVARSLGRAAARAAAERGA